MQGFENLLARISRLTELNPLGLSVTWGAGGTTKDRSLDLAGIIQAEYQQDTILHLTCTNMEQGLIDDVLKVGFVIWLWLLLTLSLSQSKIAEFRLSLHFVEVQANTIAGIPEGLKCPDRSPQGRRGVDTL